MTLRTSKVLFAAAVLLSFGSAASAQDANYLSRSDFVELSAGDASRANIAIQHPTPWPSYVNKTHIHTPGQQGISALEKMFKRYGGGEAANAPAAAVSTGSQ